MHGETRPTFLTELGFLKVVVPTSPFYCLDCRPSGVSEKYTKPTRRLRLPRLNLWLHGAVRDVLVLWSAGRVEAKRCRKWPVGWELGNAVRGSVGRDQGHAARGSVGWAAAMRQMQCGGHKAALKGDTGEACRKAAPRMPSKRPNSGVPLSPSGSPREGSAISAQSQVPRRSVMSSWVGASTSKAGASRVLSPPTQRGTSSQQPTDGVAPAATAERWRPT